MAKTKLNLEFKVLHQSINLGESGNVVQIDDANSTATINFPSIGIFNIYIDYYKACELIGIDNQQSEELTSELISVEQKPMVSEEFVLKLFAISKATPSSIKIQNIDLESK